MTESSTASELRDAIEQATARRLARYATLADISDIRPRRDIPKRNRRTSVPHRAIR